MTTYTKRTNAKRAAIKAGVPHDQVEISVYKNGSDVRFGWKRHQPTVKADANGTGTATQPRETRNGVKRPTPGGVCARVWDWLDGHNDATVKDVKAWAAAEKLNVNNASIEFYQHRRFHAPA